MHGRLLRRPQHQPECRPIPDGGVLFDRALIVEEERAVQTVGVDGGARCGQDERRQSDPRAGPGGRLSGRPLARAQHTGGPRQRPGFSGHSYDALLFTGPAPDGPSVRRPNVRTQVQRWTDANRARLNPEQLQFMAEMPSFSSGDLYALPFGFDDRRTSALEHDTLRVRRNHPVFGRDEIPAWLRFPRGFCHGAVERFEAPRDMRVRHECRRGSAHVRSERGSELRPIEKQEAVLGWQDRRHWSARRGAATTGFTVRLSDATVSATACSRRLRPQTSLRGDLAGSTQSSSSDRQRPAGAPLRSGVVSSA